MPNKFKELIFNDDSSDNWLFKRYYYSGSNSRYWTFHTALSILAQRDRVPLIIETGCQRLKEDVGAGMSTSIFGEYCLRYGGKLYTVDLFPNHLDICKACTKKYASHIEYVLSDSVAWLKESAVGAADLIYFDSLDYPISPDGLSCTSNEEALKSQQHCLNEFLAAEESSKIDDRTLILIDDNQLPGGGKPRLLKQHLSQAGWVCLMDHQQSLWAREL